MIATRLPNAVRSMLGHRDVLGGLGIPHRSLGFLGPALAGAVTAAAALAFGGGPPVAAVLVAAVVVAALVAAAQELLAWHRRLLVAEADAGRKSRLAEQHARRLETLWRIGATTLDDERYLHALLAAAGSVLREGSPFHGAIAHLDGTDFVVDVSLGPDGREPMLRSGSRHPATDMLCSHLARGRRARSWTDVRVDPALALTRGAREHGVRAFVGMGFAVGPTIYTLALAAEEPLLEPLGTLDVLYVETLAALCATRLHQRQQFDRLCYQSEHDALTAVLNRATFRARTCAAFQTGAPFALVLVDIDGFRRVNEALGQQTGDGLLVEVAAQLASRAGDDVVARLDGDAFAILMPNVATRPAADARLAEYRRAFEQPFTTGTFGEVRSVRLGATCGVALAPAHGTHVDGLLIHAQRALDAAKAAGRRRAHATEFQGPPPNAAA
jgi:diguanylate cyclase (GGDEF)-like protein